MILYHVSENLNNYIDVFYPRIPSEDRMCLGENISIKRVCVSSNIAGAFSAMPREDDIANKKFRVYEFELDEKDKDLLDYKTIYNRNYVQDSLCTKEHWILKNIKPSRHYDIIVKSYDNELIPVLRKDLWKTYFNTYADDQDAFLEKNGGFLMSAFKKVFYIKDNVEFISENDIYEYLNYDRSDINGLY
jgi:hypothetical protein